jgi:hypothetical protein
MEAIQSNPPGVPGLPASSPPAGIPQQGVSRVYKSTQEQRAKWKEDKRRRKAALSGQPYVPSADGEMPAPANLGHPIPAPAADPAAVPWNSKPFLPSAKLLVRIAERKSFRSLLSAAEKVSPELAETVRKDAPWGEDTKEALETTSAELAAKYANKAGISAENAPELAFAGALVSVVAGHVLLLSSIEDEIKSRKTEESAAAKKKGGQ